MDVSRIWLMIFALYMTVQAYISISSLKEWFVLAATISIDCRFFHFLFLEDDFTDLSGWLMLSGVSMPRWIECELRCIISLLLIFEIGSNCMLFFSTTASFMGRHSYSPIDLSRMWSIDF